MCILKIYELNVHIYKLKSISLTHYKFSKNYKFKIIVVPNSNCNTMVNSCGKSATAGKVGRGYEMADKRDSGP